MTLRATVVMASALWHLRYKANLANLLSVSAHFTLIHGRSRFGGS